MSRTDRMKQDAMAFYDLMFNECRPAEAAEQYVGDSYIQHNPGVGDGKQVFMLQRTDLQQMNEPQVAEALSKAFDGHCSRTGPSIDPEAYKQIRPYEGCGSKIPMFPTRV